MEAILFIDEALKIKDLDELKKQIEARMHSLEISNNLHITNGITIVANLVKILNLERLKARYNELIYIQNEKYKASCNDIKLLMDKYSEFDDEDINVLSDAMMLLLSHLRNEQ